MAGQAAQPPPLPRFSSATIPQLAVLTGDIGFVNVWWSLQPFLDDSPSPFPEGSANRRKQLELLALSGLRSPYEGKLGVVEAGALADLLLVDGDPIADIDLISDPANNFVVIMKDGRIYKNTVGGRN